MADINQNSVMNKTPKDFVKRDPNEVKWKDRKHWLWFPWSFTKYEVRNGRLYVQSGFFTSKYDETLLYRVTDLQLTRSFGQKICGTGTIRVFTKVDTAREIELKNIKHPLRVKEYLSELIETIRDQKNVVGKEFYGAGMQDHPMHDMDNDGIDDCFQGGPPPFSH